MSAAGYTTTFPALRGRSSHPTTIYITRSDQQRPLAPPEHFDSTPARCRGFLLQCDLHLARHAGAAFERDKVALGIAVLTGRALEWAHAVWERDGPEVQSNESFTQLFCAIFDHLTEGREGGERLL